MSVSIEDMYAEVCDWAEQFAEEYDGTIHVAADEGRRGITVGKERPHPQNIFVELTEAVEDAETVELQVLRMVNGKDWEAIGAENVGDGPTEIEFYREIPPQDASLFEDNDFDESTTFN